MNKLKKYDPYTLGNSPASVYLIDVLNNTTNSVDYQVLKIIQEFRTTFKELVKAFDKKVISHYTVMSFIRSKLIELDVKDKQLINNGVTPLVVNLTKNIINTQYTIFKRQQEQIIRLTNSSISRAKSLLKNKNSTYANQKLLTFGKLSNISTTQLEALVIFNEHGIPSVEMDRNNLPDHRTNQYLMQKSIQRLDRLGKSKSIYTNLKVE